MAKKTKAKKKTSLTKRKTIKTAAKKKTAKAAKTVSRKKTKKTVSRKKKVQAIPRGYTSITPYLIVDNATHAIDFYKSAFNAKELMRFAKPDGRVGHAELKIGDAIFMLADEFPQMGALSPKQVGGTPIGIHLYVKNVDVVVETAVAAGATLVRPVEDMFYGDRCGMLSDPYGHHWHVSTHIEDVSPAEIKKRASALYTQQ